MNEARPFAVPRLFSCLVKGPLGCLFFALGAALVGVALVPFAVGRLLERGSERWFGRHFAGSLDLEEAWVGSTYGSQSIDGLILRDPEGDEVLRASLRAPSLSGPWRGPPYRYGPVVLRIEVLRLVPDEDGVTNLERALTIDSGWEEEDPRTRAKTDVELAIALQVVVERLRYTVGRGREEMLENLSFQGTLEWGPEETRLVLAGGTLPDAPEPFRARIEVGRPEFGPRRPWSVTLELEGAPTDLARALCGPVRPLAAYAGARFDHVQWADTGRDAVLICRDEGARLELMGERDPTGVVMAREGGRASLELPCGHPAASAVAGLLLPGLVDARCADPAGQIVLRLGDFVWPVDGDAARFAGVLEAQAAPLDAVPGPAFAAWTGAADLLQGLALDPGARCVLEPGMLAYQGWRLASPHGWIEVSGTRDLLAEEDELTWSGQHGGNALPPVRLGPPLPSGEPAPLPPLPRPPESPDREPREGDVPEPRR